MLMMHNLKLLFLFYIENWRHRFVGDGTGGIQFIKANIQTFDIYHENRTVCVINGSDNDNPKDLTCFNVDNFHEWWNFPKPEIVTNLNCRYIIICVY